MTGSALTKTGRRGGAPSSAETLELGTFRTDTARPGPDGVRRQPAPPLLDRRQAGRRGAPIATTPTLALSRLVISRLRIGLLAPPWVPVPPPSYGGIEQVVATLATGLVERGHDVVLVAAPGSVLPGAELVSPLASLPGVIGEPAADWRHALAGMDALADCDVVIDHSGPLGALLTSRLAVPGLHVTHGPFDAVPTEIYEGIARHFPRLRLVAISEAQRTMAPSLPFAGVCHNGLALDAAPFRAQPDGYLAFLGRMSPEKGPPTPSASRAAPVSRSSLGPSAANRPSTRISPSMSLPRSAPTSSGWASSTQQRSTPCWRVPAPCSSRSPGRNRSAW